MIPIPWPVAALFLGAFAAVGMGIGAIIATFAYRIGNTQPKLLKDALLGGFGYLAGLIGCVLMPWPENTLVENLPGGVTVSTTTTMYQHPHRIAVIVAILLPLIHQLHRWRKTRTASLS